MRFHPHDGVFLLIEVGGAPERFYRNAVLFNRICLAFKVTIADVAKEALEVRSPVKDTRSQNGVGFGAFHLRLGCGGHPVLIRSEYTRIVVLCIGWRSLAPSQLSLTLLIPQDLHYVNGRHFVRGVPGKLPSNHARGRSQVKPAALAADNVNNECNQTRRVVWRSGADSVFPASRRAGFCCSLRRNPGL